MQRHVVAVTLWLATIIAAGFALDHIRPKHKPTPFVEPIAFCIVPGMFQRARAGDIPIGYWEQCKYVFRQQDI